MSRMDLLLEKRYTIQQFKDLPISHQKAIVWFMAVDGDAWDGVDISFLSENELKHELINLMPKYIKVYGEKLFGSISLDVDSLKKSIMNDIDISDSFKSWEEYHSSYIAFDVPKYSHKERWPVILSDDDSETLHDGWHRFHSYVRDNASYVPVVFFPKEQHLIY